MRVQYEVYQLPLNDPRSLRPIEILENVTDLAGYDKVYSGDIEREPSGYSDMELCEIILDNFNQRSHPAARTTRPITMGDVVALIQGDDKTYYACDYIEFRKLPNCKQ